MEANEQHGEITCRMVNIDPETVANDAHTQKGHDRFGNEDAGGDDHREGDEEQCVEGVVGPRTPTHLTEEAASDLYQPIPIEQQVGNNRRSQPQAQPFVNGKAGELGGGRKQKSEQEQQIEE